MKNKRRRYFLLWLVLLTAMSCSDTNQKKEPRKSTLSNEGTRQIHLDFHTSEDIADVGAKFNKEQFQAALKAGNVNAINVFAKGHHGWSYYPTKVGKVHPTLSFDLMGEQIKACKEIGVKVKLYFTVGYSAQDAEAHPEWTIIEKNGSSEHLDRIKGKGPDDYFEGWYYLPPEGEYAELIYTQTEELLKAYDVDGVWYDIVSPYRINYNKEARRDFKARGIDVRDDDAVYARHIEKYDEFLKKSSELVRKIRPNASVFYNGSTANFNSFMLGQFRHELFKYNTKNDLEDLPTAWGGYDIFPWRSKYFANIGKDVVAMSGKFHKAWGEFGGFKHKDALLYEAASMVSFGANINIGDQLHPSGIMEMATYENIGYAFDYVEKIEEYGIGAEHKATTGLYVGDDLAALEGTVWMLLENQINFNVVNTLKDWSDIEVIVITSAGVADKDIPRINEFISSGGKVIAMGEGVFKDGQPIIDIGASYVGQATYDVDYTLVKDGMTDDLVQSPFLNYEPALSVKPNEGTEVLAVIREPYFSRTLSHYCSHANTPYTLEDAAHPAVIKNNNIIYIAHNLDVQYKEQGARVHRQLFYNAFSKLKTKSFLTADMPSMGRVNLLHQPDTKRYVAHLLYASPVQRGAVSVIEDLVPLYNTKVVVDLPEEITYAYLIPSGEPIDGTTVDGKLEFTIPEFTCHTGIVLEY